MGQETREMKCQIFGSNRCVFVRCRVRERMISSYMVPTVKHGGTFVMMWGCFAGDTVCDLFRIQGTLNQHGYHSILQRYAIPSGLRLSCFLTGQWPNAHPGCVRAIWPIRRVMECCTRWPEPNWDGLGWVGPQSDRKTANRCSAYVGTPSRLLEKHSSWSWMKECQECLKLSLRKRVATFKNPN